MSDSEFVQAFRSSQEGRFEEAIAAFEELLKHQPDSAQAHYIWATPIMGGENT